MHTRPRTCTRPLALGLPRLSDAASDFFLQSESSTTQLHQADVCDTLQRSSHVLTHKVCQHVTALETSSAANAPKSWESLGLGLAMSFAASYWKNMHLDGAAYLTRSDVDLTALHYSLP